jgi:hypothetical protein
MMDKVNDRKKLLSQALNQSFVDDYNAYRNIVDNINADFKLLLIDYEWSYNDFCVDFLNESISKLDKIDIFKYSTFEDFYSNFWNFNIIVINDIIMNKFQSLGYDYSKYEKLSNNQKYLDSIETKN